MACATNRCRNRVKCARQFTPESLVIAIRAFAVGKFVYIAASGLIPEVNKQHNLRARLVQLRAFVHGLDLRLIARAAIES